MPNMVQEEQEQVLVIETFKTMNRKVKQELLPPDTLYTCQNLRYDETLGILNKRPSRRKYNSTTLGSDPITSQIRYYKNSDATQKYVIATSSFLKVGADSAGTFSNIKTGLTANQRFTFITFKDFLYCFNGVDTNQVYNGTTCEDMGVPVPTAPTLAVTTGGLTGAYLYKVTYMIDSYQEGSASVASSSISPSNQGVTVTIPTSSNTRVTHRKIYRTKANGSVYYLVATISDNTTTTYSDGTLDVSLGVTQAPTDYGVPASYRYVALHGSRVFLARNSTNKSRIIFSDIRNGIAYPDVFPADNYLDIAKDDGDEITGITEDHVGNFVVWKKKSVRAIFTDGGSPKGWSIGKPYTNFGNIAPYFLVKTPIGVIYMSRFGKKKNRLMLWGGIGVKHILEELDPILDDIDPAGIANTVGHFHNGKIYISYTDTSAFPAISIDNYTKLLLHGNGVDGSATITDSSNTPKTVTVVGNTQIDTAQYPNLVGSAGSILFDGTGDYLTLADSDDWNFGSGDFTIDFWVRFAAVGNLYPMFEQRTTGSFAIRFWLTTSGADYWEAYFSYNGTTFGGSVGHVPSPAIEANTWYHIAIVRNGTNVDIYQNGVKLGGSFNIGVNTIFDSTDLFYIGANGNTPSDFHNGWKSEFRVSKGIARWVANFTPPTIIYGYGYNNKLLIIDAETLSMINIDDKAIDSFSSWNSGTDLGELYTGTSNANGFCYEEETDTSASESTIEINAKWGKLNFGQPRLRKRLKQVKIEFDRTVASGTLSYFYSLDGATETQVDIALATYASQGYYLYDFPSTAYCFNIQPRLYSNSDISALGIERLTYVFGIEPYLQTI